jgi:hypothetical protein
MALVSSDAQRRTALVPTDGHKWDVKNREKPVLCQHHSLAIESSGRRAACDARCFRRSGTTLGDKLTTNLRVVPERITICKPSPDQQYGPDFAAFLNFSALDLERSTWRAREARALVSLPKL